jgi:phenylacetate-coenzyme A ligase PaaK-like adenylate-forming protein
MKRPDINDLFRISSVEFTAMANTVQAYQRKNNPLFNQWCTQFPAEGLNFLPISFFKSHQVLTSAPVSASDHTNNVDVIFSSSGTTLQQPSKHFVTDKRIYETSFVKGFELQYGNIDQYCILGLLPSYLERTGSSLIYMVDHMIHRGQPGSGFFLHQYQEVSSRIAQNQSKGIPTLLFGVTFALLAMADALPIQDWHNTLILETGGMKGRGPEITRDELHAKLKQSFVGAEIHSEYGMTELLSQAYAKNGNRFECPPWMQVFIQDPGDPKQFLPTGKTGRLCVVDLANINSCSFIATDDLAKRYDDGSFEVIGRIDFSDLRGCNQLVIE